MMNDLTNLRNRINGEVSVVEEKLKRLRQAELTDFEKRQKRYEEVFVPALKRLKEVWYPRLQMLAERFQSLARQFGDFVKVTPVIKPSQNEPHSGEMAFECESALARIRLKFSFYHDPDIQNLLVDFDLEIIPVFLRFEPHSRLEQPLSAIDWNTVAKWLDDRIVNFVRTYLTIHENAYYLASVMVEDPIAKVQFPKYAAKASLQSDGKITYFIDPETKQEFQKRYGTKEAQQKGSLAPTM